MKSSDGPAGLSGQWGLCDNKHQPLAPTAVCQVHFVNLLSDADYFPDSTKHPRWRRCITNGSTVSKHTVIARGKYAFHDGSSITIGNSLQEEHTPLY